LALRGFGMDIWEATILFPQVPSYPWPKIHKRHVPKPLKKPILVL
jgi:hypothetical protein